MDLNRPVDTIRKLTARSAALETYALAHDRFSEAEQIYVSEGQMVMASGAHQYALIALRAYRAEIDDPEPER
jgi:hypothetical protein